MKKDLTFEQLCEMEPELKNWYALAALLSKSTSSCLCHTWLWLNLFKPALVELVGWGRIARPKTRTKADITSYAVTANEFMKGYVPAIERRTTASKITHRNPASTCKDKILWTSTAWDVAVHAIMGQIPYCSHEGACGTPSYTEFQELLRKL